MTIIFELNRWSLRVVSEVLLIRQRACALMPYRWSVYHYICSRLWALCYALYLWGHLSWFTTNNTPFSTIGHKEWYIYAIVTKSRFIMQNTRFIPPPWLTHFESVQVLRVTDADWEKKTFSTVWTHNKYLDDDRHYRNVNGSNFRWFGPAKIQYSSVQEALYYAYKSTTSWTSTGTICGWMDLSPLSAPLRPSASASDTGGLSLHFLERVTTRI